MTESDGAVHPEVYKSPANRKNIRFSGEREQFRPNDEAAAGSTGKAFQKN